MNFIKRILIAIYDVIRPVLGPTYVCIYETEISCGNYAKQQIATQPLYKAIPRIVWRLVKCNPITGIYRAIRFKIKMRQINLD